MIPNIGDSGNMPVHWRCLCDQEVCVLSSVDTKTTKLLPGCQQDVTSWQQLCFFYLWLGGDKLVFWDCNRGTTTTTSWQACSNPVTTQWQQHPNHNLVTTVNIISILIIIHIHLTWLYVMVCGLRRSTNLSFKFILYRRALISREVRIQAGSCYICSAHA